MAPKMRVVGREADVMRRWREGAPQEALMEEFRIGRSTLLMILRRNGVKLNNEHRTPADEERAQQVIIGLRELIEYQDQTIRRLEAELAAVRKAAAVQAAARTSRAPARRTG